MLEMNKVTFMGLFNNKKKEVTAVLTSESKLSRRGKIALPLTIVAVLALTVMMVWATVPDFDKDGLLDNEEILYGTFGYGLSNNDALNTNNPLDDWIDTDHDNIADPYDWDVDGDLIPDVDEVRPNDWRGALDLAGVTEIGIDGRINPYKQTDPLSFDSDGDGRIESFTENVGLQVQNVADPNAANGIISSLQDWARALYVYNIPNIRGSEFNPAPIYFAESWNFDADNDGLVDAQDIDSDNDGIVDSYIDVNKDGDYDRGIDIPGEDIPNIDIDDDDRDEIDDAETSFSPSDTDYEEDIYPNSDCYSTNEPCNEFEGWEFSDGIWDADGMDEQFRGSAFGWDHAADNETNALNADTDFDGLGDKWEVAWATDPNDADTDDDGLVDGWVNLNALVETYNNHGVLVYDPGEVPGEFILGTDPLDPDTDGDGLADGVEVGLTGGQMGAATIGTIPALVTDYPMGRSSLNYPSFDTNILHHDNNGMITVVQHGFQREIYVYDLCPTSTTDPLNKDSDYDGLPDGWINGWGNYFWRDDYTDTVADGDWDDIDIDLGEGEDINSNGCWDGVVWGIGDGDQNSFYEAYWAGDPDSEGETDTNDMTLDGDDYIPGNDAPDGDELGGDDAAYDTIGEDSNPLFETDATLFDTDGDGLSDGQEILTDRWLGNDDLDGDVNPDNGTLAHHSDWEAGEDLAYFNHDQAANFSYSVLSDRPGAGGASLEFDSSMRDRTDPLKIDSDHDGIPDGRELQRMDPAENCLNANFVLYGYMTSPLFRNSDGVVKGTWDNEFDQIGTSQWEYDEEWNENGYTRTWLGAPYLWWVEDLRDENFDNTCYGDCTDYPVPNMTTFPNDIYRYRTDIDDDMIGEILGFYDDQEDSDDPTWRIWRPSNPYEVAYSDADRDGMVDALDPNTFYNDQDQDGLPDLYEDPDNDGIDVPCGSFGDANNDCRDDDKIWMPGEEWLETSKWDGDTDDDGLWDGDEIFPGRIELDDIPNYNQYASNPLDRDTDDDGVVDGYNNGGTHVFLVANNVYGDNYGAYNPYDPRTFNDGAWPGNANIKDFTCRWIFNTGRNTIENGLDIYQNDYDAWDGDVDYLNQVFYNVTADIPGELIATIDYSWNICTTPVWDAGQLAFLPTDWLFKAYHTATDPNNPDTDGDLFADGWIPAYNAAGILMNHDDSEMNYVNAELPHFYYLDENGMQMTWNAAGDDVPVSSGERDNLNADWLLNNGSTVTYSAIPTPYSVSHVPTVSFDASYFGQRYYQPPVDWGYFRVTYYHGAFADQNPETDRYYEYMLYDDAGIVRLINPWDDVLAPAGPDNDPGQVYEGWGRPSGASNDNEGTPYTWGNNDIDLMINALDRDSDDDEVYDWAERRGQKWQEEPGQFYDMPLRPSNPGNHNSDFYKDGAGSAAPDLEEYLANNAHPMRQWDDNSANALYDDEDGDGIWNALEFSAGTRYDMWDTDADGLSDFHEMNDFIYRAPGDFMLPSANGQQTGLGTNPLLVDSDADLQTDAQEWNAGGTYGEDGFTYNEYINGPDFPITFFRSNPGVIDTDLDGLDDNEEIVNATLPRNPDSDNDMILDGIDFVGSHNYGNGPNTIIDTDDDLLSDWQERMWYTDPLNADTDFDGIGDGAELFTDRTPGIITGHNLTGHRTEPTLWDTDGDGLPDGMTNLDWLGYPLPGGITIGEDGGVIGVIEGDDGDRIWEQGEVWTESDPLNRDSDGQYTGYKDGLVDGYEEDTNLNSVFDVDLAETNRLSLDSDGDFFVDDLEIGFGTFYPYFNLPFTGRTFDDPAWATMHSGRNDTNTFYNDADRDDDGILDGHEYWEALVSWTYAQTAGTFAGTNDPNAPVNRVSEFMFGGHAAVGHHNPAYAGLAGYPTHDFLVLPVNDYTYTGFVGYDYGIGVINYITDLEYDDDTPVGNPADDKLEVGTNPMDWDTDKDGLFDGLEIGLTASQTVYDTWQLPGWTSWDANATSQTDPFDYDSDNDFLPDAWNDSNGDVAQYAGWAQQDESADLTDGQYANRLAAQGRAFERLGEDADYNGAILGDGGLSYLWEDNENWGETNPMDSDTDDDGLSDGFEDADADRWFGLADIADNGTVGMPNFGLVIKPHHGLYYETSPLDPNSDFDGLADGLELGIRFSDNHVYDAAEAYAITGPQAIFENHENAYFSNDNGINWDLEGYVAHTGSWDVANPTAASPMIYDATAWVNFLSPIKVKRDLEPFNSESGDGWDYGDYDHTVGDPGFGINDVTDRDCNDGTSITQCVSQYIHFKGSNERYFVEDADVSTATFALVEDTDEDGIYDGGQLYHWGEHATNYSLGEDFRPNNAKADIQGFALYGDGARQGGNPYDQASDWMSLGSMSSGETDPTVAFAYAVSPRAWFGPWTYTTLNEPQENLDHPFGYFTTVDENNHRQVRFNPRALRVGYDTDGGDNGSAYYNNVTVDAFINRGFDDLDSNYDTDDDNNNRWLDGNGSFAPNFGFIVDFADEQIVEGNTGRPLHSLWTNDLLEIDNDSADPLNPWGNTTRPYADKDIDIVDFLSKQDDQRGIKYWGSYEESENQLSSGYTPIIGNDMNDPMWLLDVGDDFYYQYPEVERFTEMILDDNNDMNYTAENYYNIEGEYDPFILGIEHRSLYPGDTSEIGKFRTYFTDYESDPNGNNVLHGAGDDYFNGSDYGWGFHNDGFTASYVTRTSDIRFEATGLTWISQLPFSEIDYANYMIFPQIDEVDFVNIKIGAPAQEFGESEYSNDLNDILGIVPNWESVPGNYFDNFVQAGPFPPNVPTSSDAKRDWHGGTYTGEVYAIEADGFAYDNFALTFHVKELIPDLDIDNDTEGQGLESNVMTFEFDPDQTDEFDYSREIVIGVPDDGTMNVNFDSYDGYGTVGVTDLSILDPDVMYNIYAAAVANGMMPDDLGDNYQAVYDVDADVINNAWDPITNNRNTTGFVRLYNYDYPEYHLDAKIIGIPHIRPGDTYSQQYTVELDSAQVAQLPEGLYMTRYSHSPFGDDDGVVYPEVFDVSNNHDPSGNVYIVAKGDPESGPMAFNPYEAITEVCIDWFRLEVNIGLTQVEVEYGPVHVTNVTSTSATVSWTTSAPAFGRVDYGTLGNLISSKGDDRGQAYRGETHYTTLTGLNPNTTYQFQVVSGRFPDNNNGAYYNFTTLPLPTQLFTPGAPHFVSGCVDGATNNAIVYVFTNDGCVVYDDVTNPYDISTVTDVNGYFTIDLANHCFETGDYVTFFVDGGSAGVGVRVWTYDPDVTFIGVDANDCIVLDGEALPLVGPGFSLWTPPFGPYDQVTTDDFFVPRATSSQNTYGPMVDGDDWFYSYVPSADEPSQFGGWGEGHSGAIGTPVTLEVNRGFLSYMSETKVMPFTGDANDPVAVTDLYEGYNAVGFPTADDMSAFDVLDHYAEAGQPTATQILSFDGATQTWKAALYMNGNAIGVDYTIYPNLGYILYLVEDGSYSVPMSTSLGSVVNNDAFETIKRNVPNITPGTELALSEVHVSDISSASATITWFSNVVGTTELHYGTDINAMRTTSVVEISDLHRVELAGLKANTTYYAKAVTNGVESDVFAFMTADYGVGSPKLLHGHITDAAGDVIPGALVLATVHHDGFASQPISAVADENGDYVLNLGNLKTTTGHTMAYVVGDQVTIQVIAGINYQPATLTDVVTDKALHDVGVTRVLVADGDQVSESPLVTSYSLKQNYPNPFNPTTTIQYQIPVNANVEIKVYNSVGQIVKTLVNKEQEQGRYEIRWDGKNESGTEVGSGVYFYQMKVNDFVQKNKMVFMK